MAGPSKGNSRQHGKNAANYKRQYNITYKNKAKRVKQSNGEAFFKTWDATARAAAINAAASKARPTA